MIYIFFVSDTFLLSSKQEEKKNPQVLDNKSSGHRVGSQCLNNGEWAKFSLQ